MRLAGRALLSFLIRPTHVLCLQRARVGRLDGVFIVGRSVSVPPQATLHGGVGTRWVWVALSGRSVNHGLSLLAPVATCACASALVIASGVPGSAPLDSSVYVAEEVKLAGRRPSGAALDGAASGAGAAWKWSLRRPCRAQSHTVVSSALRLRLPLSRPAFSNTERVSYTLLDRVFLPWEV